MVDDFLTRMKEALVSKKEDRKAVETQNLKIYNLFPKNVNQLVNASICELKSGETAVFTDGKGPFKHDGEEIWFVLDGEIEALVDGKVIPLKERESVYFPGIMTHNFRNPSTDKIARVLLLTTCEGGPSVRKDYYEHLSPEDRDEALRMREKYEGKFRLAAYIPSLEG